MFPRRARLLGLALTTSLALGGCAGGTEPDPAGTAGALGASSAAYVPPSSPPTTVATDQRDKARAVDFVVSWFDILNYGLASGDADPLRNSTGLGCFTCANWITEVQQQHDGTLKRTGGAVRLGTVAYKGMNGENHVFRASLTQDAGTLAAPDGRAAPFAGGSVEVVDLMVGVTASSLTGRSAWTMKSITPPQ